MYARGSMKSSKDMLVYTDIDVRGWRMRWNGAFQVCIQNARQYV